MQQPFSPLPSIAPQLPKMGPSTPRPPYLLPYIEGFRPKRYEAPRYFTDYNDPYALNSIADVILTSLNPDMKRGNWGGIEKVPILNMLTGAVDMFNQTTLQPALHGDWKAVGINNLGNLMETFDIIANPVKGAVLEGNSGFVNALGWGADGRINYDYNTGNILKNIGLELISDPLNWVTFFGKAALTGGLSSFGKAAIKDSMGDVGEVIVKQFGESTVDRFYKKLAKRSLNNYFSKANLPMDRAVLEAATSFSQDPIMRYLTKNHLVPFIQTMQNVVQTAKDSGSLSILKGLQTMITTTEAFERTLWKSTLMNTGFGAGFYLLKKPTSWVRQFVQARHQDSMSPYKTPSGNVDILHTDEVLEAEEASRIKFNQMVDLADQLPKEMRTVVLKLAALKERSNIYEILKEPLEKYPYINVEGRMTLLRELFEAEVGGPPELLLDILKELDQPNVLTGLSRHTDTDLRPFIDYLEGMLNQEKQTEFYKMSHYSLKGKINKFFNALDEGLLPGDKVARTRQFVLEELGIGADEYLSILNRANLQDAAGLEQLEASLLRQLDIDLSAKRYYYDEMKVGEFKEYIYKKWLSSPTIEAETHLKLLEEFIRKEHPGVADADDYLLKLYAINLKHNGIYDDLEAQLAGILTNLKQQIRLQEAYDLKFRNNLVARKEAEAISIQLRGFQEFKKFHNLLYDALQNTSVSNTLFQSIRPQIISLLELNNVPQAKTRELIVLYEKLAKAPAASRELVFDEIDDFLAKETAELQALKKLPSYNEAPETIVKAHQAMKTSSAQFVKQYEELVGAASKPEFTADGRIIDLRPTPEFDILSNWLKEQGADFYTQLETVQNKILSMFDLSDLENDLTKWYSAYDQEMFLSPRKLKELLEEAFFETEEGFKLNVTAIPSLVDAFRFASFQAQGFSKSFPLESILTELEALPQPLLNRKFHLLKLKHGMTYFTLKTDQDWVTDFILSDPETYDLFMKLIQPDSDMGVILKNLVELGSSSAEELMVLPQYYFNYQTFLGLLFGADLPEKIRSAFKNVLQKSAQAHVNNFLDDRQALERFLWRVYNDIELQINSTEMMQGLSLEKLRLSEEFDDIRESLGKLHNAADDAEFDFHVQDRLLKDELPDVPGVRKICWDIETTGQSGQTEVLQQMGIYVQDVGKLPNVDVKIQKVPLEGTIHKLFPEFDQNRGLVEQYREVYKNATSSELDAILFLIDTAETYLKKGEQVVLITHNGNKFDKRFLKERLEALVLKQLNDPLMKQIYYRAHAVLQSVTQKDTLKLLQEQKNYVMLSAEEKTTIQSLLESLIRAQSDIKVADPVLIQPIDTDVAALMKEVSEEIKSSPLPSGLSVDNPFLSFSKAIYEMFHSIKVNNKKFGQILYEKNLYEDLEFQKLYGLNSSQSLHSIKMEDGTYQMLPGTKRVSTKNMIDGSLILNFFRVMPGELFDTQIATFYTKLGKIIQSNYNRLKNTHVMETYAKEFDTFLQDLLESVRLNGIQNPVLSRLKVHEGNSALNLATLQFILARSSKDPRLQAIVDQMLRAGAYKDIRKYLTDPELLRKKHLTEDELLFLEDAVDAINIERQALRAIARNTPDYDTIKLEQQARKEADQLRRMEDKYRAIFKTDQDWEDARRLHWGEGVIERLDEYQVDSSLGDPEAYYEALQTVLSTFIDKTNPLKTLGDTLSIHKASRAMVQTRMGVLKNVVDLFEALKTRHAGIVDAEEQYAQAVKYAAYESNLGKQSLAQILRLSDEDLISVLAHQGRRMLFFNGADYIDDVDFVQTLVDFNARLPALEAKGVHVRQPGTEWIVVLDKTVDSAQVPKIQLAELDFLSASRVFDAPEDIPILEALAPIREQIGRLTNGDYVGSLCEVTTQKSYRILYDALPDDLKLLLPDELSLFDPKTFTNVSYNFSLLGSPKYKRWYFTNSPGDIFSIYANTVQFHAKNLQSIVEYTELFFDKTLSINVGLMSELSNEGIMEALQNSPGFRLVALVQNPKVTSGSEVVEIIPYSVKDIERARRLEAVIMPTQTFSKAYSTINEFKFTQSGLNFWHKIVYLYKVGYLASPGAIFRNLVDALIKNSITTEDPLGMIPYYKKGFQLYHRYQQVIKDMLSLTEGKELSQEWSDFYFDKMNPKGSALDRETYLMIHNFMQDGPSAGQVRELTDYYVRKHDEKMIRQGIVKKQTMLEKMWDSTVSFLGFFLKPHKEVEQVARLSEYLWAVEKKGMSDTDAFAIVAKTHFDYALKTRADHYRELIFPFYTFTMRNLEYWLDALENTPWLASVFRDMMTPVWDFDSYDQYEIEHNQSLQYQILSGNLPLNDKGMTLKINPSVMDVYNMVTNPFNALKEKLVVPLQLGVNELIRTPEYNGYINATFGINAGKIEGAKDVVQSFPLIGTLIQRYGEQGGKYYDRTGNPLNAALPDVFGATLRYKPYAQKPKQSISYTSKLRKSRGSGKARTSWKTFYKKSYTRKAYYKNTWHRPKEDVSFYKKHYTKTGYSRMKLRMQPVTPGTLKYRIKDLFHYLK